MNRRKFTMAIAGLSAGAALAGQNQPKKASKDKVAKHDCKGKNDCKGQGGCGSGDNGCAGKNSCKGKGGCSMPAPEAKSDKK